MGILEDGLNGLDADRSWDHARNRMGRDTGKLLKDWIHAWIVIINREVRNDNDNTQTS